MKMSMKYLWNNADKGKLEKAYWTLPLWPSQVSQALVQSQTWASAVKNRRLTAL
jgi:hypothetical protein